MAMWTSDELTTIAAVDELDLASRRLDDTLRKPVTVWVVRVGDELYTRAVNGRDGAWFRGVQERHAGHIQAGGVEKDVTFVDAGDEREAEIDTAYRAKYHRYSSSIVETVLTPQARAATIRLEPRS